MNNKLLWIYVTVFVNIIGFGIVFPLLPLFAETFKATDLQIGFLAATFSLGQFIFSPFFGRLSDRFGRRPIIIFSIATSVISFVIMAQIKSLPFIFISRFLDGISSAAGFPVAQSYIADITTPENRSKYMGRISAIFSLGFVIGPVFGGVLGSHEFSTAFWAAAILSFINLIFVYFFLPESITKKAEKFVLREGLLNFKAIYHGLRGDFSVLFLLLALWAYYISNFQLALPLFTQDRFHFGVLANGLFFSITGFIATLSQWFLLPIIVKKIGEVKTIFIGVLSMAVGQLLVPLSHTIFIFFIFFVISIIGSGLNRPSINALLSKSTKEGQGTTLGLAFSFESIGRFTGPLVGGLLIGSLGVSSPFWIIGILLIIGLIAFWRVEMQKER